MTITIHNLISYLKDDFELDAEFNLNDASG